MSKNKRAVIPDGGDRHSDDDFAISKVEVRIGDLTAAAGPE